MNQIAAAAVALKEASTPDFKEYASQVVVNARTLSESLKNFWLENCIRRYRYSPNAG